MTQQSRRLPNLDGLRAIAILAVFIAHSGSFFNPNTFMRAVCAPFNEGVDLFFAISGLLITTLLYREYTATSAIHFKSFYIRRAFRILPPFLLYLGVIVLLGMCGLLAVDCKTIVASLLFYRNYLMYLPYGGATNHFWSLSVEEHFYVLWPLCLSVLKPKRAFAAGVAAAILIAFWRGVDAHAHLFARIFPDAGVKFRTDTRLDSLLWGAVAALALPHLQALGRARKFAFVVPVLFLFIVTVNVARLPMAPTLLAVAFAALTVFCVIYDQSLWTKWLSNPVLSWLGALSYSLYLWQTLWLQTELMPSYWPSESPRILMWIVDIAMIFACASASFYFVEQPSRRLGYRAAGGRVVVPSAAEI